MAQEPHPVPTWIVCSPGTGGTGATLGRYVRYRRHDTRVLCADPEHSVFYDHFAGAVRGHARHDLIHPCGSGIEGIGRPKVERSFIAACIDAMVKVPDALSLAAMRHVSGALDRRVGGSTGTNVVGVLAAAERMRREGRSGSIVSILCDGGDRYSHSYYNPAWYVEQGIDTVQSDATIARAVSGEGEPALDVRWLERAPEVC
jgi:cysteine synthase A